jgi:hypothetical protein
VVSGGKSQIETDVVVVGSGTAGLVGALAAPVGSSGESGEICLQAYALRPCGDIGFKA